MRWLGVMAALFLAGDLAAAENDAAGLDPKEAAEGFVSLFDGKTTNGWQGATKGYSVKDGVLVCEKTGGGNLYTAKEYANFVFRFEFNLEPGANNGVGVRAPMQGDAAYVAMEIQILDDSHDKYKGWLKPHQRHGSIYGVVPAKTGHLKPAGQWNCEEIECNGRRVKVTLNGAVIVDADLDKVQPVDGHAHPGLKREKGFIGFLGHGDRIEFRNLRIKEL